MRITQVVAAYSRFERKGELVQEFHTEEKISKPRIGMKIVKVRVGFDCNQAGVMHFVSFPQPFEGLILFVQNRAVRGDLVGRNTALNPMLL